MFQMDVTFLNLQAENVESSMTGKGLGSLTYSVEQCETVYSQPQRGQGDSLDSQKKYPIMYKN